MTHRAIVLVVSALIPALSTIPPAWAEDPLPTEAYIDGVPFVGYHKVRDAEFPDSNIVNPSLTAVLQMMYAYWGEDFIESAQRNVEVKDFTGSGDKHAALDDLKAMLANGLPVSVTPATTPEAHRLYLTPKLCGQFKPVAYTSPQPASGALGEMVPLRAVEQLRDGSCGVGLNDSVILASKLLVGYDDAREIFIMHDPSLGPDLELGYADFERMWRATEASYFAAHPAEVPTVPAGRVAEVRARTPDDEAAVALFRAYGLEVAGDYTRAEQLLREALRLEGLDAGRRHLLQIELAVSLNEMGHCTEAIEAARGANTDFDDYALAHTVLARLLACSDTRADRKEAKRELSRAKNLCSTEAQRRVADELGRDFHVIGCKGELLGWYRP